MANTETLRQLVDTYPTTARASRLYRTKTNGEQRPIAAPNDDLKRWLRDAHKILNRQFSTWPGYIHAVPGRSYVTFARDHVGKPCVITIDIRECFDSMTEASVVTSLEARLGLPVDIAKSLASLLCFKGVVPQGFPTSNFLCNLHLLGPMESLNQGLRARNLTIGNYVDDFAVSGAITEPDKLVNEVAVALSRSKLSLNKSKVRVMPSNTRQTVCGLLVNKRLSVTRELRESLFSDIAKGKMSSAAARGWIAHLKDVNPGFSNKLQAFAMSNGLVV